MINTAFKVGLVITLAFMTMCVFAGASAVHLRGEITVSWTNDASTNCATNQIAYYLKEYRNGTYTKTINVDSPFQKSQTVEVPKVVPQNTAYGYVVYYFKCLGSGGNYLLAGSTTTNISPPVIENRRVIYIHTDLQGSPAAESNERGELTND